MGCECRTGHALVADLARHRAGPRAPLREGTTRAKTFLGDDYALCLLEDVFTRAEQTLIAAGKAAQVQSTRHAFQDAVGGEFTSIVESVTGKRVRALMSQVNIEENLAAELFLFEQSAESGPTRDEE